MGLLSVGEIAPEVICEGADGGDVRLSQLRGRYVVVYFYSRDESPGCTLAACNFSGGLYEMEQLNATVIGVCTQAAEAHRQFRSNHAIAFPLSADPGRRTAKQYGVSRLAFGLLPANRRASFLVDPEGRICQVWPRVQPSGHYNEVLSALRRRSAPDPSPPAAHPT